MNRRWVRHARSGPARRECPVRKARAGDRPTAAEHPFAGCYACARRDAVPEIGDLATVTPEFDWPNPGVDADVTWSPVGSALVISSSYTIGHDHTPLLNQPFAVSQTTFFQFPPAPRACPSFFRTAGRRETFRYDFNGGYTPGGSLLSMNVPPDYDPHDSYEWNGVFDPPAMLDPHPDCNTIRPGVVPIRRYNCGEVETFVRMTVTTGRDIDGDPAVSVSVGSYRQIIQTRQNIRDGNVTHWEWFPYEGRFNNFYSWQPWNTYDVGNIPQAHGNNAYYRKITCADMISGQIELPLTTPLWQIEPGTNFFYPKGVPFVTLGKMGGQDPALWVPDPAFVTVRF